MAETTAAMMDDLKVRPALAEVIKQLIAAGKQRSPKSEEKPADEAAMARSRTMRAGHSWPSCSLFALAGPMAEPSSSRFN